MKFLHQTGKEVKGKKMLLVVPLAVFPFLTLLFWVAGGGKDNDAKGQNSNSNGLNVQLPEAQMKNDKAADKLSFYQQASKESARKEEERRKDSFWNRGSSAEGDSFRLYSGRGNEGKDFSINYNPLPIAPYPSGSVDENEARVYRKLAGLNIALAQSQNAKGKNRKSPDGYDKTESSGAADTRKLEAMIESLHDGGSKDPELDQLNTMLDKIAAIQHPDDINFSSQSGDSLNSKKTITVRNKKKEAVVSLLQTGLNKNKQANNSVMQKGGFYNDAPLISVGDTDKVNTFRAILPQTQVVATGATVQLQLNQDIDINGTPVGKGSYVFGTALLRDERLQVKITSIQWKSNVYPVSLEVYDMDGLAGVYVPGSLTSETVKQSTARAISGLGITSMDPSLGAQAAGAGIEAVKSMMGRKVKVVKVTIPAGYQVLLKDIHSN